MGRTIIRKRGARLGERLPASSIRIGQPGGTEDQPGPEAVHRIDEEAEAPGDRESDGAVFEQEAQSQEKERHIEATLLEEHLDRRARADECLRPQRQEGGAGPGRVARFWDQSTAEPYRGPEEQQSGQQKSDAENHLEAHETAGLRHKPPESRRKVGESVYERVSWKQIGLLDLPNQRQLERMTVAEDAVARGENRDEGQDGKQKSGACHRFGLDPRDRGGVDAVAKDRQTVSLFRDYAVQLAPGPLWVLERIEKGIGMGHQPEESYRSGHRYPLPRRRIRSGWRASFVSACRRRRCSVPPPGAPV